MNTYYLPLRVVPQQIAQKGEKPYDDVPSLLNELSVEEKLTLIAGIDNFCIPPLPAHHLPPVWLSDATSGVRGVDAQVTIFPSPIAMAATFDKKLIFRVGQAIAKDCRAVGISIILAPGVNIARVPINGRNFEYLGEDPYLAGDIASMYVKGVQSKGVGVTVKHFACNNSEYDRHKTNSVVDEKTLREIYLPPFKACIDSGAVGIMTSYNQINGEYASEHSLLLKQILRKEWAFPYLVVSDWNSLYSHDRSFAHGVDLEMPKRKFFPKVDAHLSQEETQSLDEKVLHILNTLDALGVYKRDLIEGRQCIRSPESQKVALSVAQQSLVLLKNEDNFLPLKKKKNTKIAVIGRFVNGEPTGGGGSSFIKQGYPGKAIQQELLEAYPQSKIRSYSGHWYKCRDISSYVSSCDVVIVSVGFTHVDESEAYDRRWTLHKSDVENIVRASKMNPKTVVITHSGGAIEMPSWIQLPKAVIFGWYTGEYSAQVLRQLLFGEFSPSGRLPITIGRKLSDYASMKGYPEDFARFSLKRVAKGQGNPNVRTVWDIPYDEKLMVGYRQFDTIGPEPLYPFGFGLSYSTFTLDDLEVTKEVSTIEVSLYITNTGEVDSAQVVQLYVRPEKPQSGDAFQQLKGFERVFVKKHEKKGLSFTLDKGAFTYWDEAEGAYVVDSKPYTICLGFSSREILLTSEVLSI